MSSALRYNQDRLYSSAQISMIQRTVGTTADGVWGPGTVSAVVAWQKQDNLPADGKVGPKTLVAIFRAALTSDPTLFPITTVGAWTGQGSFPHIDEHVQFCVDNGINRLDVVVNDHSARRTQQDFTTYTKDKIVRLCTAAKQAGLEVHLMSWIMPYQAYLQQAAEQLIPLCQQVGASSLMWDAEEPWTQAQEAMPYEEAAAAVKQAFAGLPCPMSVTGIGYTPVDKLGPLAKVCRDLIPQCYATSRKGSPSPSSIVSTCVDRWRKSFGADASFLIGLAAYKQSGIEGHTVQSAMEAALLNARAYAASTVVYWSLRQIQGSPEVTSVIAGIRKR